MINIYETWTLLVLEVYVEEYILTNVNWLIDNFADILFSIDAFLIGLSENSLLPIIERFIINVLTLLMLNTPRDLLRFLILDLQCLFPPDSIREPLIDIQQ